MRENPESLINYHHFQSNKYELDIDEATFIFNRYFKLTNKGLEYINRSIARNVI